MSHWWKLPAELGGGLGEEKACEDDWIWLYIPGRAYRIKVKASELTKSPPPCPPEPDKSLTLVDRTGRAWQRLDTGSWKCIDGMMYSWPDLWDRRGPIMVLGPPADLAPNSGPEELWPWKPIKWVDVTEAARQTVWTGSTVSDTDVQVSKAYAVGGGRKKDNRRVSIQVHFPGYKPQFLSFTTDVARDLSEALMYASGDD